MKIIKDYLDCYKVGFHEDFKYCFNITFKKSGTHIGWYGIEGLDFDHNEKEVFYLIGKDYWRKGYAKEVTLALLDYAFNVMRVKEVVGLCKPENIASKKVLKNMGLKFRHMVEGLPKEFNFYNGEPFYSLTKAEYLQKI